MKGPNHLEQLSLRNYVMLVIMLEILCLALKEHPLSILIFPAILFSMGDLTLGLACARQGLCHCVIPQYSVLNLLTSSHPQSTQLSLLSSTRSVF